MHSIRAQVCVNIDMNWNFIGAEGAMILQPALDKEANKHTSKFSVDAR